MPKIVKLDCFKLTINISNITVNMIIQNVLLAVLLNKSMIVLEGLKSINLKAKKVKSKYTLAAF